ncbi:MAG: hypothetical protein E7246_00370 [Lachnoclostridium sp.]|nr:hypothetical protein [Lachnoclostridium sp.]
MKKVLVSIRNGLLSEAIVRSLRDCGEFLPYPLSSETCTNITEQCKAVDADIVLMEVSYLPGATVEVRLKEIRQIRNSNPGCKIAVLCDENATPELAYKVTQLKRDHLIDSFFYTSVTANYLMSTLASL